MSDELKPYGAWRDLDTDELFAQCKLRLWHVEVTSSSHLTESRCTLRWYPHISQEVDDEEESNGPVRCFDISTTIVFEGNSPRAAMLGAMEAAEAFNTRVEAFHVPERTLALGRPERKDGDS